MSQSLSELGQFQNTLKNSFLSGQKKKTNQARSIVFESGGEDSLIKGDKRGRVSIIPDNFNFTVKFLISISKITLHNYYMLPKKRSRGGGDSMTFQNILCTCKFKENVCWEKRGSPLPHLCYVSAKSEMLDTFESVSSLYITHLSKNWALHNVSFS